MFCVSGATEAALKRYHMFYKDPMVNDDEVGVSGHSHRKNSFSCLRFRSMTSLLFQNLIVIVITRILDLE